MILRVELYHGYRERASRLSPPAAAALWRVRLRLLARILIWCLPAAWWCNCDSGGTCMPAREFLGLTGMWIRFENPTDQTQLKSMELNPFTRRALPVPPTSLLPELTTCSSCCGAAASFYSLRSSAGAVRGFLYVILGQDLWFV